MAAKFLMLALLALCLCQAQELPSFDLGVSSQAGDWGQPHDAELAPTSEGLSIQITGGDPYLFGPARDYPTNQPLWLNIRLKADQPGGAQLFYFQTHATEANSVRFNVRPSTGWQTVRVPFPALGAQTRLRFDPPGAGGVCVVSRISFERRTIPAAPEWPQPVSPQLPPGAPKVVSGDLELRHGRHLGEFGLFIDDTPVAVGNTRAMVGYETTNGVRWVTLTNRVVARTRPGGLSARAYARDPDGATWRIDQDFSRSARRNGIEVQTSVRVSEDRSIVYLPFFTLLAGAGSFGTNKTQALLAGVEYLENEPSSSEKDVIGPGARRQVPDSLKLTFPLMAIAASGHWLGLTWEQQAHFAALHDSPDRIFNSGGHVMSIIYPGSDPVMREDGSILPYGGQLLRRQRTMTLRATILGGRGNTVIPAVQEYAARRGLPKIPDAGTKEDYIKVTTAGWLDSKIRTPENTFRHAVGPTFGAARVADAPLFMRWLSALAGNERLDTVASNAIAQVPRENHFHSAVGHIRTPAPALFNAPRESIAAAEQQARNLLGSFGADGSVRFSGDLARTHWTNEANGLTATRVATLLEAALFSGHSELIARSIELVEALSKFDGTVPRGAQTWEVPLHTPDILASAHLVRAYTLAHELTGKPEHLARARYWAWTGVPFIYLANPTAGAVGPFATIAVYGATQYTAPLWIGLPVQWCGLVYGDAIRGLIRHDPQGPWLSLANGIAASGIQQNHTATEPELQGLLPDSFDLRSQTRNPVPINPGTLQAEALQFFGEPPLYDFRAFRRHNLLVHARGGIGNAVETDKTVRFDITPGFGAPSVIIHGLTSMHAIAVNGGARPVAAPFIVELRGPTRIEITRD